MSTTYLLYLEKRVVENGEERWKCVDGYYKVVPYGKTEEALRLSCLYSSGSRSYFGEAYDKLREIGTMTPFAELSREIREAHPSLAYEEFWNSDEKTPASWLTVSKAAFDAAAPKGFERHAVCHMDAIAAYENGDAEEPLEDEDVDLSTLDEESRKCWRYYEWDSPYGWQAPFKKIADMIRWTEERYANDTWDYDPSEERIVVFAL